MTADAVESPGSGPGTDRALESHFGTVTAGPEDVVILSYPGISEQRGRELRADLEARWPGIAGRVLLTSAEVTVVRGGAASQG